MVEIIVPIFIFVLGLCIGSFLNVCIYRMGLEQSVVKPPSHCPKCKKPIRWHDNIPLISFIVLRGRCRDCRSKISIRYFFVELLTGLLFLALFIRFGLTPFFFIYALFASGLIVATFVDFDFRIIPDEISVGGLIVGLVLSGIYPVLHETSVWWLGLAQSLLGILVGGGILWVLGALGDFMFKKESMGGGDIKLLAMIGAFLGWKLALLALPLASVIGAVVGIIEKIRTKNSVIAFGPYLALGALVGLFWGDQIISYFFYTSNGL
jgi:leader peptidase (prepilin peptidase)/N-methyltransferase